MALIIQNSVLFQLGWLCCVIGGATRDYSWAGVVVVAVIVAVHLARARDSKSEILLIIATLLIGTLWDSGLMMAGVLVFSNGIVVPELAPLWLIAMWALFATTLNVSMKWMKDKYWLAAVFGALGGPLAYYAGHRLSAVDFNNTAIALLTIGAGWAIIMPVLMAFTKRFNGYDDAQGGSYEVKSV